MQWLVFTVWWTSNTYLDTYMHHMWLYSVKKNYVSVQKWRMPDSKFHLLSFSLAKFLLMYSITEGIKEEKNCLCLFHFTRNISQYRLFMVQLKTSQSQPGLICQSAQCCNGVLADDTNLRCECEQSLSSKDQCEYTTTREIRKWTKSFFQLLPSANKVCNRKRVCTCLLFKGRPRLDPDVKWRVIYLPNPTNSRAQKTTERVYWFTHHCVWRVMQPFCVSKFFKNTITETTASSLEATKDI